MINKILFFCLIIHFNSNSQVEIKTETETETETIVISKSTFSLFRGVLAETKSWYLLNDDKNNYYLANLERPNDGVFDWFVRFKDSQNIYKSNTSGGNILGGGIAQYPTLHFIKENEPGEFLNFYIDKSVKDVIILTSLTDGIVYRFELQIQ